MDAQNFLDILEEKCRGTSITEGASGHIDILDLKNRCQNYNYNDGADRNKDLAIALLCLIHAIERMEIQLNNIGSGIHGGDSILGIRSDLDALKSHVDMLNSNQDSLRSILDGITCRRCGEPVR